MAGNDEKPKGAEALKAIEEGLGNLFGRLSDVLEGKATEHEEHREFGGEGSPLKGVVHSRVRVGPASAGSASRAQSSARKSPPMDVGVPEARDLLMDVIEDGDDFIVTCELPGVVEDQLSISIHGAELTVQSTGEQAFHGKLTLSSAVLSEPVSQHLNNGILELRLQRQEASSQ